MPNDTRYGFTRDAWATAKSQARDFLIECARERGTTTYSGLCDAVSAIRLRPYSFAMMAFLNEVCAEEDAAHGVMLASLVTRRDTGLPGMVTSSSPRGWAATRSTVKRSGTRR